MSITMRFSLAMLVACTVAGVGAVAFEAIGIGGIAWYGLALVAMFAGSLFDRERFYGPSGPSSPQAPRT